ncbi:hypothetical protein OYC64_016177 [Pagothenia borchgrevinki]|uniref:C2H2-type domain-containing protein n=1 Tax=Pagothenia borchgrevinki TaxID=8213 RepID=A0ABD2HIQ7_PAGBO
MKTECPLCCMQYRTLPRHLVVRHHVHNPQERNILLQMAHGRINIRTEPCTVVGCGYHGTRLDRHINCDHPELSQEEADLLMKSVKHSSQKRQLPLEKEPQSTQADAPPPPWLNQASVNPETLVMKTLGVKDYGDRCQPPPSVNILESSEASRRRDTEPSTSGVKCKKKRKHTSQEHGVVSKTARDEGQGRVGTRRISATPRPTSRSSPVATCRYTPGLLEAMKDTAVNATGGQSGKQ